MFHKQRSRALDLRLPATPQIVHHVRQTVEEFIRPCGYSGDEIEAIKWAVSEACANAVVHGSPQGDANFVQIHAEINRSGLQVDFTDEGSGFRPRCIALPGPEEWRASGRGLYLMKVLMDDVQFEATSFGTRVRLLKRLPDAAPVPVSAPA